MHTSHFMHMFHNKTLTATIVLKNFIRFIDMTPLSLIDIMNLLGVDAIINTPRQVERFRRWIEIIVEKRGNAFVL